MSRFTADWRTHSPKEIRVNENTPMTNILTGETRPMGEIWAERAVLTGQAMEEQQIVAVSVGVVATSEVVPQVIELELPDTFDVPAGVPVPATVDVVSHA